MSAPSSRRLAIACALVLTACRAPDLWGIPAAPPTASPTVTATSTPRPTETPTLTPTSTAVAQPGVRRVVIVSFDGLRPDLIDLAPMPVLGSLIQTSAYSLTAQTIFPSSTLPAHSSMLGGLCPARHNVLWNDYLPLLGYARGTDLFDLAHAAGMQTVMYVGKDKLRQVTEPASTDVFVYINDRDLVIVDQLIRDFPADFGLLFVHFPLIDMMGHEYGWLSPEQFSVAARGDEALARLLVTLDERGLRGETLLIVTADHGGHSTTHGYDLPEDMTIPWIASGPGIQPGPLTSAVQTMDTAATAAWALDLTIPSDWDGRPVTEAFGLPAPQAASVVCPMPVLP